jgi:murein DD-endopeptidase MepM/ murein hydrolase activator NlpD
MNRTRPAGNALFNLSLFIISILTAFSMSGGERSDSLLTIEYEQPEPGKYVFYASNRNAVPYQVELRLYYRNSDQEIRPVTYAVIPAGSTKFRFSTYQHENSAPPFRYRYRQYFGDPGKTRHKNDHAYLLPWRDGEEYMVIQGYKGKFSHQDEYSIDFRMPEGTPVHAARGGVVIHVKDDSNRGGPDPEYREDGNFISLLHDDGTFAEYVHLRYRGSRVKTGDRVRAGDPIAYSGNTGFSTTPHLHFSVKVPGYMRYDTTPTIFHLDRMSTGRLEEGKSYKAVHF